MICTINGEQFISDAESINVACLLEQKGISPKGTAVALNGKIAMRKDWETTLISDGDTVVIISAAYGG